MPPDAPRVSPPGRDLAATLDGLLAIAVSAVGADAGAVYLIQPPENDLRLAAGRGLPEGVQGHRLALGEALTGRVAAEGRSLISADVQLDPRAVRRRPDWDVEPVTRSYLGVPLRAGSLVIGALELTSRRADAYDLGDRGHVYTFADAAALLIEQTRLWTAPPPMATEAGPSAASDPVGVLTANRRLMVTSASPAFARLLGQPIEGLVGRPLVAVLPGLGRPRARDVLEVALHGTPGHLSGIRLLGPAGQEASASVSVIPFGDAAQGVAGLLLAVQDVTERVRLEAELRSQHARTLEASDRLRAVMEVITHELRTPLTSVLGYARLLHDRPAAEEGKRIYWAGLVTEKARMMARLVDEITDLARMGSPRFRLAASPTDLGALVQDVAASFEPHAEGHTLEVTVEQGLPALRLDRDRIGQVLLNLLTNAAKYWPGSGAIQVRVVRDPAGARVEVTDRGPGVPRELAEQVFEPFVRADTAGGAVAGSGLGLSVARGIVEAHGGRIWLEPAPGGGTTVRFVLPEAGPPPSR
jgi:PAS domain S-box-containing protein